ncbi:MAG: site-specific DNA-methyltransferase, partial [Myxococcales bacterium]|nr:site-specific DNA-methyltransferase [Myxococcales bacterium]
IEGDNLEVLRLLLPAYRGAAGLVYLDPPYNTGGELIYPDNYRAPLRAYLQLTGQHGDDGSRARAAARRGGHRHARWLSMMYPRLALARELLAAHGFLCVSISELECAPLRLILDELLGEEAFVAQLVWRARKLSDARAKTRVSIDHEYVLVYRGGPEATFRGVPRDETKFKNPDDDPRGPWMSRSMLGLADRGRRPRLHYAITDPATGRRFSPPPASGWRYGQETMARMIAEGRVLFPRRAGGRPREKKFRAALQHARATFPSIIDGVYTGDGTRELRELLGFHGFDFPKPSELVRLLIEQTTGPDALIVDLFAGSGTTGHAVARQNAADQGARRYLCVQLPEPLAARTEAARRGLATIADITRARLARVAGEGGGFRAFRLVSTERGLAADAREDELDARAYALALAAGYPLTVEIERVGGPGARVYSIAGGRVVLCLEGRVEPARLDAMIAARPGAIVLLDPRCDGERLREAARAAKVAGVHDLRLVNAPG